MCVQMSCVYADVMCVCTDVCGVQLSCVCGGADVMCVWGADVMLMCLWGVLENRKK